METTTRPTCNVQIAKPQPGGGTYHEPCGRLASWKNDYSPAVYCGQHAKSHRGVVSRIER